MIDTPVLSVAEARPLLPQLIKRTVQRGEEIHMGARQRDEATLVASAVLARYKHLAQIAQRLMEILPRDVVQQVTGESSGPGGAEGDPWAGLKDALRDGRIAAPGTPGAFRRALPTDPALRQRVLTQDEGAEPAGMTWSAMALRGNRGNRPEERGEVRRPFRPAGARAATSGSE